jgi:hypothetical protein
MSGAVDVVAGDFGKHTQTLSEKESLIRRKVGRVTTHTQWAGKTPVTPRDIMPTNPNENQDLCILLNL